MIESTMEDANFWKGRNVLITGAAGFVGSNLAAELARRDSRVVCLERDLVHPNSLDIFGLRDRVTIVRGSVEDIDVIERALNEYEIDAVFHLAAQALVGVANRSPLSTFETNIRGSYMVLEACRRSPLVKRVVVASSDKAYGTHEQLPYSEEMPLNPSYPYDVSKTCTDVIAQSFAKTFDLPVSISRSANIYGPGDLNLSRIIPGTIASILKAEDPIVRSDGTPIREFVYVADVVEGYLRLAENIEATAGEAFNFGTDHPIKMLDLVNLMIDLMGETGRLKPNVLLKEKIAGEIDAQYLSSEKISRVLGWRPATGLSDGLKSTIEWYREKIGLIGPSAT